MEVMFWVWLGVIVVSAIIEFATMEIVSIWFTFGAIIPFILAACKAVGWEVQLVIFVVISAVLIATLRRVTKKLLLKNVEGNTNVASLIGNHYRMIERTDFETIGSVKVNDVVWTAVSQDDMSIEKGEIVEVVAINGNKLVVKKTDKPIEQNSSELKISQQEPKKKLSQKNNKKNTGEEVK